MRGQLVFRADERAQALVVDERVNVIPSGALTISMRALGRVGDRGGVDLEHAVGDRACLGSVDREALRVEAAQVREAPVLVGGGRERQLPVALEGQLPSHSARTCGGA